MGPKDQESEDQGNQRPGDQDQGTRTRGPGDHGTRGPGDQRTRGPGDQNRRKSLKGEPNQGGAKVLTRSYLAVSVLVPGLVNHIANE